MNGHDHSGHSIQLWAVMPDANPEDYKTCHIVPIQDTRGHTMSHDCWCSPQRDADDPTVLVHSSADQREMYESGERKAH